VTFASVGYTKLASVGYTPPYVAAPRVFDLLFDIRLSLRMRLNKFAPCVSGRHIDVRAIYDRIMSKATVGTY
jgi:hypothetical protein